MKNLELPTTGLDVPRRAPPTFPRIRFYEACLKTALTLHRARYQAKLLASVRDQEVAEGITDQPSVFHGFERDPLSRINDIVVEDLGWHITHNDDLPEVSPEDRIIYIVNHPTLTASFAWAHFMGEHFAENEVAVGKDQIIKNPFYRFIIGELMQMAEKGIFINRDDRSEALSTIEDASMRLLTPGTGAIIMADAHRPYPSRLRKEVARWSKKFPDLDVESWMKRTCFPRSGGLWTISQATSKLPNVRFFDCTVVEPEVTHEYGGHMHIDVREISRIELLGEPENLEHLQGKLVEMWKRKGTMIEEIRT